VAHALVVVNDEDVEVLIGCNASGGLLTLLPTAIKEAAERMTANILTGKNLTQLQEN